MRPFFVVDCRLPLPRMSQSRATGHRQGRMEKKKQCLQMWCQSQDFLKMHDAFFSFVSLLDLVVCILLFFNDQSAIKGKTQTCADLRCHCASDKVQVEAPPPPALRCWNCRGEAGVFKCQQVECRCRVADAQNLLCVWYTTHILFESVMSIIWFIAPHLCLWQQTSPRSVSVYCQIQPCRMDGNTSAFTTRFGVHARNNQPFMTGGWGGLYTSVVIYDKHRVLSYE